MIRPTLAFLLAGLGLSIVACSSGNYDASVNSSDLKGKGDAGANDDEEKEKPASNNKTTADAGSTTKPPQMPVPQPTPAQGFDAGALGPGPGPGQGQGQGKWFAAFARDCVSFCTGKSMTNVTSTEGAMCASPENVPQS